MSTNYMGFGLILFMTVHDKGRYETCPRAESPVFHGIAARESKFQGMCC